MTRLCDPWPEPPVICARLNGVDPDRMAGEAKRLLRGGVSLSEAARSLGVLTADLDRLLWSYIGEPEQ